MKAKTPRSSTYREWIATQPCVACGAQDGTVVPAHVRIGNGGGMGLKPSDFRTLPLCFHHHTVQHSHGERTFWAKHGDPDAHILRHLCRYLGGGFKVAIAIVETHLVENGHGD